LTRAKQDRGNFAHKGAITGKVDCKKKRNQQPRDEEKAEQGSVKVQQVAGKGREKGPRAKRLRRGEADEGEATANQKGASAEEEQEQWEDAQKPRGKGVEPKWGGAE